MHVHILPRKLSASVTGVEATGDPFAEDNDAIYPAIEAAEEALPKDLRGGDLPGSDGLRVDAPRAPRRSMEEMVKEAEWLKGLFDQESGENQVDV